MKPIRTKKELAEAKKSLRELRKQLAALRKAYRHDRDAFEEATGGLRQLERETAQAIAVYEEGRAGRLPAVVGTRNPHSGELEVGRVLRRLRLAAGLNQGELARLLGTHQPDIARWEQEGYDRYVLHKLQRLADALGYDLEVSFLRRETPRKESPS